MSASTVALLLVMAAPPGVESQQFEAARGHVQQGRVDEALEVYAELAETGADPVATAIGVSRALSATGRLNDATKRLQEAIKAAGDNSTLLAQLAALHARAGEFALAEQSAASALRVDADEPLARLVLADVLRETGRIAEADTAYRWFVRFYNRKQPQDAETLLIVARGALQYARWNSVSQIYDFVVNTLCPDALADDDLCWQAHHLSGSLLLEKYNREQALPEFRKALAINPRAAEVLTSLAKAALQERDLPAAQSFVSRALDVNPTLVSALQLQADLFLAKGRIASAREVLSEALTVNPHNQSTLARIAACELLKHDSTHLLETLLCAFEEPKSESSRQAATTDGPLTSLFRDLAERNRRPGKFLTQLGLALEDRRRYPAAELAYQQAIVLMPQLAEPKTALGLLYMRVGKIAEAQQLLDDAFRADPFHVRVSNMRKVISLLDGYETISTEHFVIRVGSADDRLLGRYMAEYLEEIYPELVLQFGYEPPHRTQFEIFSDANGLSAHEWFSARMVGLPWIQTIGASTGVVVALASPTAAERPFNWARVLKHEFVHVITLQQTGFNIPHWFTEALAVTSEGGTRPAEWNRLLAERVPRGELFNLDTLDDTFARPESPDDWQFAYCLSRIYAQYMIETCGDDCIRRLLGAYRRNLSTGQAIEEVFGIEQAAFEEGYRRYLQALVDKLRTGSAPLTATLADLEEAHLANPRDPENRAAFAYGLLQAGRRQKARQLASDALSSDSNTPLAAVVLSDLKLSSKDVDGARKLLQKALDRHHPHSQVLARLAELELEQGNYAPAAELYELGSRHFADDPQWLRGMAAAYWRPGEEERLKPVLEQLAMQTPDDVTVRKKRAEIALEEKDFEAAIRYGRLALQIDVLDAEVHRILGDAYRAEGRPEEAVLEFEAATQVKPDDVGLELALAEAYIAAGRPDNARSLLERIIAARGPEQARAKQLLEELD